MKQVLNVIGGVITAVGIFIAVALWWMIAAAEYGMVW